MSWPKGKPRNPSEGWEDLRQSLESELGRRGVSRREFAKFVDVSEKTVRNWLAGRAPSASDQDKIAAWLLQRAGA